MNGSHPSIETTIVQLKYSLIFYDLKTVLDECIASVHLSELSFQLLPATVTELTGSLKS